jgi:retron-type reverse transcriptase
LKHRDAGRRWVVDGDIKDCFERLDHDVLMRAVSVEVKDPQVQRLLQLFLKAKVMNEVDGRESGFGVVQGGVISPLLSNVYLHAFDERMTRAGLALVRYADDWIVLCASESDARAALNQTMDALAKLKLAIHPQKTWITHFDKGFSFLGVFFLRGEHFYLSPTQAPASIADARREGND